MADELVQGQNTHHIRSFNLLQSSSTGYLKLLLIACVAFVKLDAARIAFHALSVDVSISVPPPTGPIVQGPDKAVDEGDWDFAYAPSICGSFGL